ncbi:MAG: SAM-dependent methyltransferase, partial [Blastocatellia bacterium]
MVRSMEESKSLNLLGRTSKWAAAQRARESPRADRLFEDPLAEAMAGEDGFEMLRRGDEVNPQSKKTADLLAVRTRFFDDLIIRSVSDGIRQVVILAAGLDCRVFRLDLPTETEFYELDQKPVIEMKEQVLLSKDARTKCRRVALPVDLRENWVEGLWKAGFRTAPSIWIMEGLLY